MAIICSCHAVRERTIVKAIHHGAVTLEAVQDATGAATCCGSCTPSVVALLEQHAAAAPAGSGLLARVGVRAAARAG